MRSGPNISAHSTKTEAQAGSRQKTSRTIALFFVMYIALLIEFFFGENPEERGRPASGSSQAVLIDPRASGNDSSKALLGRERFERFTSVPANEKLRAP